MSTFVDIDLSFNRHPGTGDLVKRYDVEAVKQSIKNIFFYNKFAKPFDARFGVGIESRLFEGFGPIQSILLKRIIGEQLAKYEPRANIEQLNVVDVPDEHTLEVELKFYVVGNVDIQTLNISLERTR